MGVDTDATGRLHGVGEDVGALGVGDLADALEVVQVAVLVRDQRDGDELGAPVSEAVNVGGLHLAVAMRDDAELDPQLLLERAVEDVARVVVELRHHHVVAGLWVETPHRDVLALACGADEADLVGIGVDQPGEALADLAAGIEAA
jgi:hypothetical protein